MVMPWTKVGSRSIRFHLYYNLIDPITSIFSDLKFVHNYGGSQFLLPILRRSIHVRWLKLSRGLPPRLTILPMQLDAVYCVVPWEVRSVFLQELICRKDVTERRLIGAEQHHGFPVLAGSVLDEGWVTGLQREIPKCIALYGTAERSKKKTLLYGHVSSIDIDIVMPQRHAASNLEAVDGSRSPSRPTRLMNTVSHRCQQICSRTNCKYAPLIWSP